MARYQTGLLEEELKNKVAADWFAAYDTTRIIGKVDFCVAIPATELGLFEAENALGAEAKAGVRKDIHESCGGTTTGSPRRIRTRRTTTSASSSKE